MHHFTDVLVGGAIGAAVVYWMVGLPERYILLTFINLIHSKNTDCGPQGKRNGELAPPMMYFFSFVYNFFKFGGWVWKGFESAPKVHEEAATLKIS